MTRPATRAPIPAWLDGLGMGWVLTPFLMWISDTELWAALLAFLWLALRAYFGSPPERRCMGLGLLFGILFELSLWRTGACLYQNPGVLYTPLWILPLWAGGGLLLTRFTAPTHWEHPANFRRGLSLLPFVVNCLLPSSWLSSMLAVLLALLTASFLWRESAQPPQWGRALRVLLVGIGGTSASWSFGASGVCVFPQAWHGIPPWALSLWTSLVVVLLALRRGPASQAQPALQG